MKFPPVVAFGSIARVGKDSSSDILAKHIKIASFSFAYELKMAVDPLCREFFGISAFTQDDKEKLIIRPLLVTFGNTVRTVNPRAWIEKVHNKMRHRGVMRDVVNAYVITDLRFDAHDKDEYSFVKNELGGIVVNLDRIQPNGELLAPANDSERENYAKIKAKADICIAAKDLVDLEQQIVTKVIPLIK